MSEETTKTFKILSLDGGGVRGIIPLKCLSIYKGPDFCPAEGYDLIVGTSVGALLSGCFAVGMTVKEAIEAFKKYAPKIFKRNITWPFFARSKYPITGVEEFFDEHVGDRNLGTSKTKLMVCTYSTRMNKGTYFKSWKRGNAAIPMRLALRASMAAPVYFPPCPISDLQDVFLDGGLTGNNDPTSVAYTEAISFLNRGSNRLVIESFGCGNHDGISNPGIAATVMGKLLQVMEALFTCATDNVEQLMKSVRVKDPDLIYTRFNPVLYENIPLDSVDKIPYLEAIAAQWMLEHISSLGSPSSLSGLIR